MKKNSSHVFIISFFVIIVISICGIVAPDGFESVANSLFAFITTYFGWSYLILMTGFVGFVYFLAFSKFGKIRLGKDNDKPIFSYPTWFSMLFCAGMGTGLVFWGAAEPLNHFINPIGDIVGGSEDSAEFALFMSFFHWGIHPWANYLVIALPLAYMQFRKGKPGLISSIFIPLIGEERVKGPIGQTVDILAIFAVMGGIATSLGLGVLQIGSGLNFLFGIPVNNFVNTIIVVIITTIFLASAISGIEKGMKFLSNLNVCMAFGVMLFLMVVGPTIPIINSFTNGLGSYITNFASQSFKISAFGDNSWVNEWTIFYWAWWISWAPYVGVFIARISKGRTIKEFILGTTLVPVLGSFLWFAVVGTTSISLGTEVATEAIKSTSTTFFVVLQHFPLEQIVSGLVVILLCIFFVTSADSSTFVLGMLSRKGTLNPDTKTKFIWGITQSLLALVLMYAGGLQALQTGSIVVAFPFLIVMFFGCISFIKVLREDKSFHK